MVTDSDPPNMAMGQTRQQQADYLAQTYPWDAATIYRLLVHRDDEPALTD